MNDKRTWTISVPTRDIRVKIAANYKFTPCARAWFRQHFFRLIFFNSVQRASFFVFNSTRNDRRVAAARKFKMFFSFFSSSLSCATSTLCLQRHRAKQTVRPAFRKLALLRLNAMRRFNNPNTERWEKREDQKKNTWNWATCKVKSHGKLLWVGQQAMC